MVHKNINFFKGPYGVFLQNELLYFSFLKYDRIGTKNIFIGIKVQIPPNL